MIELQIEREPIEQVIDMYSRIKEDLGQKINLIIEENPEIDGNSDVRLVSMKLTMEVVQTNILVFYCIRDSFKNLEIWEYQEFENEAKKQEFLNDRLYFISGDLRENVFSNTFLRFENFIKIIANSLNIPGERINKLSKDLIEHLDIADDYKNLIDLFTYLRNTVHTAGFHNRDNVTVNYKGVDYEFVKDSPTIFYNNDFLELLVKEVTDLMKLIIDSEEIKEKDTIEHNYSNLVFNDN